MELQREMHTEKTSEKFISEHFELWKESIKANIGLRHHPTHTDFPATNTFGCC